MTIDDAVKDLFDVRSKIKLLEKEEDSFKTKINGYFDNNCESSFKAGDIMAVRELMSKTYLDTKKAGKFLTKKLIKAITTTTPYTQIKTNKVE